MLSGWGGVILLLSRREGTLSATGHRKTMCERHTLGSGLAGGSSAADANEWGVYSPPGAAVPARSACRLLVAAESTSAASGTNRLPANYTIIRTRHIASPGHWGNEEAGFITTRVLASTLSLLNTPGE